MELTKDCKGRNVTCDNYFSTLNLVSKLKSQKIILVGTVKRDKAFLPLQFKEKKALGLHESIFFIQAKHSACVIGGVDTLDQMAHSFTTKRKTKRWPLVYFFKLLDLSIICARIVYKLKNPEDMFSKADNRQMFNIQIGGQLALPHIKRRLAIRTLSIPLRDHIQIVTAAL